MAGKPNDIKVTVVKFEPMSGNRAKVKIRETYVIIDRLTYDGKNYEVSKYSGRGRYIMKEAR
jgi:hypothetical protein